MCLPTLLESFPGGASDKEPACQRRHIRNTGSIPGSGRSLEEGVAIPSSVLAWRTPWTEEAGGLRSTGSHSWARTSESADTTGKAPCRGIPHNLDRCAPSGLQPNVFSALTAHRTVLTSPPHSPWSQGSPGPPVPTQPASHSPCDLLHACREPRVVPRGGYPPPVKSTGE